MPLIAAMYGDSDVHVAGLVALPLLVVHPLQLITGSIMAGYFKRWVERGGEVTNQGKGGMGAANSVFALLPVGGSVPLEDVGEEEEQALTVGEEDGHVEKV